MKEQIQSKTDFDLLEQDVELAKIFMSMHTICNNLIYKPENYRATGFEIKKEINRELIKGKATKTVSIKMKGIKLAGPFFHQLKDVTNRHNKDFVLSCRSAFIYIRIY